MKPHRIGRGLGIGLRVAGRIAGQRMTAGARTSQAPAAALASSPEPSAGALASRQTTPGAVHAMGKTAARGSADILRGLGGILRPFRRAGGIVWLEVTGVFFLLFVPVFGRALWRMRTAWFNGEDQPRFLFFAALMAVFFYLGVSSFWRARRK
jgi:hypothetical protein